MSVIIGIILIIGAITIASWLKVGLIGWVLLIGLAVYLTLKLK